MSTRDRWSAENMPPQITVRAFGDEPHVLFALEMQSGGRHVNVCGQFPYESYIGWPLDDTFDYDIDDFQQLWEAYSRGDKESLAGFYSELRQRSRRFIDILSS